MWFIVSLRQCVANVLEGIAKLSPLCDTFTHNSFLILFFAFISVHCVCCSRTLDVHSLVKSGVETSQNPTPIDFGSVQCCCVHKISNEHIYSWKCSYLALHGLVNFIKYCICGCQTRSIRWQHCNNVLSSTELFCQSHCFQSSFS